MYKNFEVVFRLFDISSNSYYPSSLYVSSNIYVSFFFRTGGDGGNPLGRRSFCVAVNTRAFKVGLMMRSCQMSIPGRGLSRRWITGLSRLSRTQSLLPDISSEFLSLAEVVNECAKELSSLPVVQPQIPFGVVLYRR